MVETKKLNILDESKLKIIIENNEIQIYDEYMKLVGKQYYPQHHKNKNIKDEKKQLDFRHKQNEKIQEIIQNILNEVVIERSWYDVWIKPTSITIYSPSQQCWVTEPKTKVFELFTKLFNEELK